MKTSISAILVFAACALPSSAEPPRRGQAKLAIAMGTVEARVGEEGEFKSVPVGGDIDLNSWVKTGPKSKAVFDFTDGTELRINENSEILVSDSKHLEVKVGEMFTLFPKRTPPAIMYVKTKYSPIEFEGGIMDVSFRHRDPSDPATKTISRTVTTVSVVEGVASVGSKQYSQNVTSNYWCTLVDATLNTPNQIGDISIPTRWVHELLLQRGRASVEIDLRLKNMLQKLGRYPDGEEDLSYTGYKSLGALSVQFLVDYLKKPATIQETGRRRVTAKLIGELATKDHVAEIALVLNQPDAETKVFLAKGLERVAGTNLRFDEAFWKGDKIEPGIKAWQDWAKANPSRR